MVVLATLLIIKLLLDSVAVVKVGGKTLITVVEAVLPDTTVLT